MSPPLHVREWGPSGGKGAVPVLLVHGFTGSAEAWGEPIVRGLARAVPVLAADLPGHGASSAPSTPVEYEISRVVEGLLDVLDRRGVERADWVGYSMGGRIALAATVLRPDRVRRLVLESASPGLATPGARRRRRTQDEALARRIETQGLEWFVDHWMDLPLFRTQQRLPAPVLAAARKRRLAQDPRALAAVLRGLGTGVQPSYWEDLSQVETPTLILTGALDAKYEELAQRMVAALPRAVHRSVPGAGHTVHLEAPARWLEEVVPFLKGRSEGVAI